MSTLHINAQPGDFAETVLLPGDPLRARYIAERFLHRSRLVTDVRNMLGYTGYFRDRQVSVMGSGMGIPSCVLYATELLRNFSVKYLIRVGSCGAVSDKVELGDVLLAMGACTDSSINRQRFGGHDFAAIADYQLLQSAVQAAQTRGVPVKVGNIFSTDLFYGEGSDILELMEKMGVLGVEMEAAGLYGVAHRFGGKALCMATVSDHLRSGQALSPKQRQTGLDNMIEVGLQTALLL